MPATLLVLSADAPSAQVRSALSSAAESLGHSEPPAFAAVPAEPSELELLVHEFDPWSVVAIDDAAVDALGAAFGAEASGFAPDNPVTVRGYTLVAVPGFAECLDDLPAKRVAWGRLQAARHPGIPY